MTNKVTYRQQYTRCGKDRCRKCKEGSGHGPYWYAYWSEKGRTVSKYIGTNLPQHLANTANGEDELASSLEINTHSQSTPILRIYLLGQFRIEYWKEAVGFGLAPIPLFPGEWQAADSRTSHRRRTRALLGCLLSSPSRRLGREQVMAMLWPGLDVDLAANRLNGAVHELRQILEPDLSRPSSSRLLRLERDTLELADKSLIWVDAEAFEQLLKEAETSTDIQQAGDLLEKAATLYQGSYLPEELYSEWAVPRRDVLQRAWVDLQLRLTQIKVEQEAYISAIESLSRLRTADPTNETALQQLMILLTHEKRRAEALQIYKQYRSMLKRDYESQPLPETANLYDKLRRGQDVSPLFSIVGAGSAQGIRSEPRTGSGRGNEQAGDAVPTSMESGLATDDSLAYTRPIFQLGHQYPHPLIGREQEQQKMRHILFTIEQLAEQETLTTATSRYAHLLLLRGEPGIGKTRMVEELSLEAYNRDWTVAWSRSYEQEGSIPYFCWTQLLRTLLDSDATFTEIVTSPAMGAGLAQGKGAVGIGQTQDTGQGNGQMQSNGQGRGAIFTGSSSEGLQKQARLHLWEATVDLLAKSKFHPLLLVFDDIHWADDSSIELLTYVTRHLQGQPVLLIATCRDGELAPEHKLRSLMTDLQREKAITMISANPLTQSQIGKLVSYLPQKFISSIQMQSSGNPFFAEELARSVYSGEQGQLDTVFLTTKTERENVFSLIGTGSTQSNGQARGTVPTGSDSVLPDAITAVLERRLHLLSRECRTLLSRAAFLGDPFELEQLWLMASEEHNEEAILDLLEEALHAGILIEEEKGVHVIYHFWHPLIMNYLYSHISAARRAQWQRKVATLSATSKNNTPESLPERGEN